MELIEKYKKDIQALVIQHKHIAIHAVVMDVFYEIVHMQPKPNLIVELGVGVKGLRTQAVCRAASLHDAVLIGCDIADCRGCGNSWYPKWYFFQKDARQFADEFQNICQTLNIEPVIDVLFIDTDELYETTKTIYLKWKTYLALHSLIMFRCSNLQKTLYYADGSTTRLGWDNQRGVIRVIEEVIGGKFDETKVFNGIINGWRIKHIPWGAGLTILRRENE